MKRILLIRHGLSEANADPTVWDRIPDLEVKLTRQGKMQAQYAGKALSSWISKQSVKWIVWKSPAIRAVRTGEEVLSKIDPQYISSVYKHPLLVEKKFGQFDVPPESYADVEQRVTTSIDLFCQECSSTGIENVIVFSHAITIQTFVMLWCGYDDIWLKQNLNIRNCSIRLLEDCQDRGYIFDGFDDPSMEYWGL